MDVAADVSRVLEPVSPEAPCGPDLEIAGDPDFLNLVASAEIRLPESYFRFDPATFDFDADFRAIDGLAERTRDLRLLVLEAKLAILSRDLARFARALAAVAALLSDRWEDVHPAVEDGDGAMRLAALAGLDDRPHVILPLAHAPLARSARHGALTFRLHQLASAEVPPREGEDPVDPATLARILEEIGPDGLAAPRAAVVAALAAAEALNRTVAERLGAEAGTPAGELAALLKRMAAFLGEGTPAAAHDVPADDVAAAAPPTGAAGGGAPVPSIAGVPPIATGADADAALAAVEAYFAAREPSSPALVLVARARSLVGRSFPEIVAILAPDRLGDMAVRLGRPGLVLPIDHPVETARAETFEDGGRTDGTVFHVTQRDEARAILQGVKVFYEREEPSSPVPMILDEAIRSLSKDFLSLVRSFLPPEEDD